MPDTSISTPSRVVVLGGGIIGCMSALELANNGNNVTIIEQLPELLSGTSDKTPGRLGLGFHYLAESGLRTAKEYMEETISFARRFPDCIVGRDGGEATRHLTHGRYFFTPDTFVPSDATPKDGTILTAEQKQEITLANIKELQRTYAALVAADPANEVFGKPEDFYRVLDKKEYEGDVSTHRVLFGVETRESLLDWKKVKARLSDEIKRHPKIRVQCNSKVLGLARNSKGDYAITTHNSETGKTNKPQYFRLMVNATWENIEALNAKLGIVKKDSGSNRLKFITKIQLPEAMRNKPSMFFGMGSHAMFTNNGDGTGFITHALLTNHGSSTKPDIPKGWKRLLRNGLPPDQAESYGRSMLTGVVGYIPGLKDATVISVTAGIVKIDGPDASLGPTSDIHRRNVAKSVKPIEIGAVAAKAAKLSAARSGAADVLRCIKTDSSAIEEVARRAKKIIKWTDRQRRIALDSTQAYVRMTYSADELNDETIISTLVKTITARQSVLQEISWRQAASRHLQVVYEALGIHPDSPPPAAFVSLRRTAGSQLPSATHEPVDFTKVRAHVVAAEHALGMPQVVDNGVTAREHLKNTLRVLSVRGR